MIKRKKKCISSKIKYTYVNKKQKKNQEGKNKKEKEKTCSRIMVVLRVSC